jgi:glycolate oxidase FAD binding subunit
MTASHSSSSATASVAEELRAIVGPEHVRPASAEDAVDGVQPQFVVEPATAEEVAKVLKSANDVGLAVAARGGGSKIGWGNRPQRCDLVLSLVRMNKVVEHAASDLTVSVEAGCTVGELQKVLGSQRQRLALDPLWPERATVGGVLATNDGGSLRIRFGALRDLIIGITLALPDGTLAKSGGKVVKNVAGYDLPKLATGALGTLAVITDAVFRLHPVFPETRSLTVPMKDAGEANKFVLAVLDSKLAFTGLQVRTGREQPFEVDIRFEGTEAGVTGQCGDLAKLAGATTVADAKSDAWGARQALFEPGAVVAKFSIVPAGLASFCSHISQHAQGADWRIVAQATGIGYLRIPASADLIKKVRSELEPEGSLVVLQCPPEMKSQIDAWGSPGDTLGLMRRVKHEFDPKGTLNPGRFVGGI